VALCHLVYESKAAFREAFAPHAELLMGDMINYTDIEPVFQVSEIRITR
jgi:uncharacterized protein (TIGR02118 family)